MRVVGEDIQRSFLSVRVWARAPHILTMGSRKFTVGLGIMFVQRSDDRAYC